MSRKKYLWWLGLVITFAAALKTGMSEISGGLWAIAGTMMMGVSERMKEE